ESLRVLNTQLLTGFVVKDNLVLGAMILKHAVNVLHSRDERQERQKQDQTDDAVHQIHGQIAAHSLKMLADFGGQVQRNHFIQEKEEPEGEGQVYPQQPARHLLVRHGRLAAFFIGETGIV